MARRSRIRPKRKSKQASPPVGRKSNSFRVTLPPGRYFLGDPCYAVRDDIYYQCLREDGLEGAHSHEGHAWASAGTWGGDGLYESTPGKWQLGVDSGTLGAVPEALWKDDLKAMKLLEKRKLGKVVVARKRVVFSVGARTPEQRRFSYKVDDRGLQTVVT